MANNPGTSKQTTNSDGSESGTQRRTVTAPMKRSLRGDPDE